MSESRLERAPGGGNWRGSYMDGLSARVHDVTVVDAGDHLIIQPIAEGTSPVYWPLIGLAIDALQEGEVHLQHSQYDQALLSVPELSIVSALRGRVRGSKLMPGGQGRVRFIALGLVAIAGLAGLAYWQLPRIAQALAYQVPLKQERQLGAAAENWMEKTYCRSGRADAALAELAARLDPRVAQASRIHIVNVNMPNAFTLPGGTIFITRGLIEQADSADEVAGVLAHEMAHVQLRHVMAQVIRSSILTAAWGLTVGDFTGLMVVDPSTAYQIANLRFSRDDETAADEEAFRMLARARISSAGMAAFFARVQREGDAPPEWLSTHPGSPAREEAARRQASSNDRPALGGDEWLEVKSACNGVGDTAHSWRDLF